VIGRLTGTVVEQGFDGTVLLEVNGVGYEVLLPQGTLGRLGVSDEQVTIYIHTHAREDALLLYGFESADDKAAFRALLGVSSVGPKSAMAVLGSLDAEALARAVETDDRAALKGIPGVGKKTIERILLDLKGKIVLRSTMDLGIPTAAPRRSVSTMGGTAGQVVGLLTSMGYKRAAAESCVGALDIDGKSTEELLREALRSMG